MRLKTAWREDGGKSGRSALTYLFPASTNVVARELLQQCFKTDMLQIRDAAKQELMASEEDARSSSIELPVSLTEKERCLVKVSP